MKEVKMEVVRGPSTPDEKLFSDIAMSGILDLTPQYVYAKYAAHVPLTSAERTYVSALWDAQRDLFEGEVPNE
jgi:hypothetical protein